jgi:hypothetical protein
MKPGQILAQFVKRKRKLNEIKLLKYHIGQWPVPSVYLKYTIIKFNEREGSTQLGPSGGASLRY